MTTKRTGNDKDNTNCNGSGRGSGSGNSSAVTIVGSGDGVPEDALPGAVDVAEDSFEGRPVGVDKEQLE
jgi:hypothetical protein